MSDHPHEIGSVAGARTGRVFKKSKGHYYVRFQGSVIDCSISSKLRKDLVFSADNPGSTRSHVIAVENIRMVDPIAIGDDVHYVETETDRGHGVISEVLPRRTKFSRLAAGHKPLEQVIAANVDQVVAVFAVAQPDPAWNLLDRYLLSAEVAGLPAVICITKLDLMEDDSFMDELRVYEKIGYRVILTSAETNWGVDKLKGALKGLASVLLGKSGVGKSTLLNVLQPGLGLRISEVSAKSGKGRHTTTHLEMFDLEFGGHVIDTPGMREFGLWNPEDNDPSPLFPELRPYLNLCHFGGGCSHTHEPGCAVKEAVEQGEVTRRRYESYLNVLLRG